jgi:hypothetical protein
MLPCRGSRRWVYVSKTTTLCCWTALLSCTAFRPPYRELRFHRSLLLRRDAALRLQLPLRAMAQGWQAGDVEQDFARLEQAIDLANAGQNAQYQERMDTLDYISRQRRPISSDLIQFVGKPLVASFVCAILLKSTNHQNIAGCLLHKALPYASILHFWCLVVLPPMFLLGVGLWNSRCQSTPYVPPHATEPTVRASHVYSNSENPATSTRDYTTCLVEQWTSSIVGSILCAKFWMVGTNTQLHWIVQLMTRFGALASLHQYPKLWFELIRNEQLRPLSWRACFLRTITRLQCTQWLAAVDLALFMANGQRSWPLICLCYGSSLVAIGFTVFALQLDRVRNLQLRPPPVQTMARAALLGWAVKHRKSIRSAFLKALYDIQSLSFVEFCVYFPWVPLGRNCAIGVALLAPLYHIWAIMQLVRIQLTHGLSLAMDSDSYEDAIRRIDGSETGNVDKHMQKLWRYKLSWREPQRIRVTLNNWRRSFWYWMLVSGSVEDKLRREYRTNCKSEAQLRGLTVLQRVAKDRSRDPTVFSDRSEWKQKAMDRIAKRHQDDYDAKTFNVRGFRCPRTADALLYGC